MLVEKPHEPIRLAVNRVVVNMAVVDGDLQVFERPKKLDGVVVMAQREFLHAPVRASPRSSVNRELGLSQHIHPGPFLERDLHSQLATGLRSAAMPPSPRLKAKCLGFGLDPGWQQKLHGGRPPTRSLVLKPDRFDEDEANP